MVLSCQSDLTILNAVFHVIKGACLVCNLNLRLRFMINSRIRCSKRFLSRYGKSAAIISTALMTILDFLSKLRDITGIELRCSLICDFWKYHWNV